MRKIMVMLIMLVAAAVTASADTYEGYNRGGYRIYAMDDCNIETDGKPTEAFITVSDTKYKFSKTYNFHKREDLYKVIKQINRYVTFDFVEKILDNEELIESSFTYDGYFWEEYYIPSIE